MVTETDYQEMTKQRDYYRDRMEAAEAKLSLISRGYKVEDVMNKEKAK